MTPASATIALIFAMATLFTCSHATVGKSTYAMTHPFAFRTWMEKYLPYTENVIQKNSTSSCNEWVKLCIDSNGCSPQTFQIHSVGAYLRDSGSKSMETLESEFTQALGGMGRYDPFMELHTAFYTSDLDGYVAAFQNDSVAYFPSTFQQSGSTYYCVTVQVDGSLKPNTGSLLALTLIGSKSALLPVDPRLHIHDTPRASATSLHRAEEKHRGLPHAAAAAGPASLTPLHISWPTANLEAMVAYFEGTLSGTKVETTTGNGTQTYYGKLFASDTLELRWEQSAAATQGPTTVKAWEEYTASLHKKCIACPNSDNQGFDRLADQHIGGRNPGGESLSAYIAAQQKAGYSYRVYAAPNGFPDFLYLYGPNGWGYQITGSCGNDCGSNVVFYDECTQGTTGHCSKDL